MVMYAVKFIVAAAAAVFAAAATKKDADAVIRGCTSPNKATLVIDGLSRPAIKAFLTDLPKDVTFLLSQDDIRSRQLKKFAMKVAAMGEHNLVYRLQPKYDGHRIHRICPRKLFDNCNRAKKLFKKIYGYDLRFVYFPWSKHRLAKLVKAVELAGLTVFGDNFDLPKHFSYHEKHEVKRSIKKLVKRKERGAIIYLTAQSPYFDKNLDWVERKFEKKGFEIVSLDECLAKAETSGNEEAPAAEETPEMDEDLQAPAEEEAAEGAASALTYSAAGSGEEETDSNEVSIN